MMLDVITVKQLFARVNLLLFICSIMKYSQNTALLLIDVVVLID